MRNLFLILITTLLLSCLNSSIDNNQFTSDQDTLIINTLKKPGISNFPARDLPSYFSDTSILSNFNVHLTFPKDVENIKVSFFIIDIKLFAYEQYKAGRIDNAGFAILIKLFNIDTLTLPKTENSKNTIFMISATKRNDTILIVDENNNADFNDDQVRHFKQLNLYSTGNLIKCEYCVYNGHEFIIDSTWLNIGKKERNEIGWILSKHLEAKFKIDKNEYKIGVIDQEWRPTFDRPLLALREVNGIVKDSTPFYRLVNRGEFIQLENTYYKFYKVSNDGSQITLIKEKNYETLKGNQIGLLAPDFTCVSTNNDTITNKKNIEKTILIANVSGCAGGSYYMYKYLINNFKNKFNIIGIYYGNNKDMEGTLIDANNVVNKDFSDKFRQGYSSFDCYLIDTSGRIVEKFRIFEWEENLKKYMKD